MMMKAIIATAPIPAFVALSGGGGLSIGISFTPTRYQSGRLAQGQPQPCSLRLSAWRVCPRRFSRHRRLRTALALRRCRVCSPPDHGRAQARRSAHRRCGSPIGSWPLNPDVELSFLWLKRSLELGTADEAAQVSRGRADSEVTLSCPIFSMTFQSNRRVANAEEFERARFVKEVGLIVPPHVGEKSACYSGRATPWRMRSAQLGLASSRRTVGDYNNRP